MFKDPIVAEVRKSREILAAKFKYDIKAILSDAQERQKTSKHKIVFLNPTKKTCPTSTLYHTASKKRG